jgi:hypothetical protein
MKKILGVGALTLLVLFVASTEGRILRGNHELEEALNLLEDEDLLFWERELKKSGKKTKKSTKGSESKTKKTKKTKKSKKSKKSSSK